ncbi:MAG: insulinase family protein [Rhizobiaceae bacterium]|nr:insulinase family protein [Rhizobiaceae bacterium]
MRRITLAKYKIAVFTSILVLLGSASTAFSKSDTPGQPKISEFKLENGLQVVVIPDHRAPVVTHMVWYKAGSADEPTGKSGIAHYLEHLMFKGTTTVPAGEFSAKVSEIGGQENAFTTADYTAYYQKIIPSALKMVMTYEADRMENLILTDETVLPERNVILEERRQRVDSNPGAILGETSRAMLFKHHPYGRPVIGWEHEMLALTKDDAIAFYDKFYTPNNAVLVIAGDVTREMVETLANATYGKVKRRAEPGKRVRVSEPEPIAAKSAEYFDKRVTSPSWRRSYLVPSYNQAKGNDAEALDILAVILGGASTSRINQKIILGDKSATAAGSYYQGGSYDMSTFSIYGVPRGDVTLATLETAIENVIANLIENGVTQKEVDRARNRLINTTIFDRDSQTTMARMYGAVLSMGGTIETIEKWPERVSGVSVEDVERVAKNYLKKSRSVTSYLRPEVTN